VIQVKKEKSQKNKMMRKMELIMMIKMKKMRMGKMMDQQKRRVMKMNLIKKEDKEQNKKCICKCQHAGRKCSKLTTQ